MAYTGMQFGGVTVHIKDSSEIKILPIDEAIKLVRAAKAYFHPEELIDGKSLNQVLFGIDVESEPQPNA